MAEEPTPNVYYRHWKMIEDVERVSGHEWPECRRILLEEQQIGAVE